MNQYLATSKGKYEQSRNGDELIDRLQQIWIENQVENYYQCIFKEYIKYLPYDLYEIEIEKEISLTQSHQSFFFTIENLAQRRRDIYQNLKKQLTEFDNKQIKTEKHVQVICESLDNIRNTNLLYSQSLLNLHNYFIEKISGQHIYSSLKDIFLTLHSDNQPLRKSLMRKFIVFSQNYDPCFLKHYELLKSTNNPRLRELKCIQELFNLPINQAYRMQKVQKDIKKYLKNTQQTKNTNFKITKTHKSRTISPVFDRRYKSLSQKNEIFTNKQKIENSIYLMGSRKSQIGKIKSRKVSEDQQYSENVKNEDKFHLPRLKSISITRQANFSQKSRQPSSESYERSSPTSNATTRKKQLLLNSINLVEQRQKQFKNMFHSNRQSSNRQSTRSSNQHTNFKSFNGNELINKNKFNDIFERDDEESLVQVKQIDIQCDDINLQNITKATSKHGKLTNQHNQNLLLKSERVNEEKEEQVRQLKNKTVQVQLGKQDLKIQSKINLSKSQQISPTKKQQPIKDLKSKMKKYHLKAFTTHISQLLNILQSLKIKQQYKRMYQNDNTLRQAQYYFHKLFINQELATIALCCPLPDGKIAIKYWGPLQNCDFQMSNFLFSKYLEHIQKKTTSQFMYFNAPQTIRELFENGFVQKGDRYYIKQRTHQSQCDINDFSPFLSIDFTSIAINKSIADQHLLIEQQEIAKFELYKFLCFNYLLIINKLMHQGSFSQICTYSPNLKSVQQANFKIIEHFLSQKPYNSSFKCSYCHLLTLKIRNVLFSAIFTADKGYIKLVSDVVVDTQQMVIVSVQLLHNSKIYFGKAVNSAMQMVQQVKKNRTISRKIFVSVHMFRKKLRGKIPCINLKQQNTFGDFQLSFIWKDFIQGKVKHDMMDSEQIFDDKFYCLYEMENQVMFVFEVLPQNFVE